MGDQGGDGRAGYVVSQRNRGARSPARRLDEGRHTGKADVAPDGGELFFQRAADTDPRPGCESEGALDRRRKGSDVENDARGIIACSVALKARLITSSLWRVLRPHAASGPNRR